MSGNGKKTGAPVVPQPVSVRGGKSMSSHGTNLDQILSSLLDGPSSGRAPQLPHTPDPAGRESSTNSLPGSGQQADTLGIAEPSSFNIILDKSKRIALRKALEEGGHVPHVKGIRRITGDNDAHDKSELPSQKLSESELNTLTDKLDRLIRWNSFLTHTSINAHELIDCVTKGALDQDSQEFVKLRQKVLLDTRSYKNEVIDHFEDMIDQLMEKEGWLRPAPQSAFIPRFKDMLNAQNFFFCFSYMKEYVDFEGSSDRGRWYMQSVFINLGVATWRWIKSGKGKGEPRDELLTDYDACALNPLHDEIAVDDFNQLTQNYRNQRERKKRGFSQINSEFIDVGPMPSKSTRRLFTDSRSQPLDSLDEGGGAGGFD